MISGQMFRIFLVMFLSILSVLGQDREGLAPQINEEPRSTILRGKVIYKESGQPLRRARIGLLSISDLLSNLDKFRGLSSENLRIDRFVLIDDNGDFTLAGVKPGVYYPFVDAPNIINPQTINKFFGETTTISLVRMDQYLQTIDVTDSPENYVLIGVDKGSVIGGTVRYVDSMPAVGVRVEVFREGVELYESAKVSVQKTWTDDRGVYRIIGLLPGRYFVKATIPSMQRSDENGSDFAEDYFYSSMLYAYYPGVRGLDQSEGISLAANEEILNGDIVFPDTRLYSINGVVVERDTGAPVAGAIVKVRKAYTDGEAYRGEYASSGSSTEASTDGRWRLKDLPAGEYELEVSTPAGNDASAIYRNGAKSKQDYARTIRKFEIKADELPEMLVEVDKESSISGQIVINGDPGGLNSVSVYAVNDDAKSYWLTTVNRGRAESRVDNNQLNFRIGTLAEGNYRLSVDTLENYFVESIFLGSEDISQENKITVGRGENVDEVKIVLSDQVGKVTGTVKDSVGNPVKIRPIIFIPTTYKPRQPSLNSFQGRTVSTGEFSISVAPGEYYVVLPRELEFDISTEQALKELTKNAGRVKVEPGKSVTLDLVDQK